MFVYAYIYYKMVQSNHTCRQLVTSQKAHKNLRMESAVQDHCVSKTF